MTPRQVHDAVSGVVALYGGMVEALEALVSQLQANLKVATESVEAYKAQVLAKAELVVKLNAEVDGLKKELDIVRRERDDARPMVSGPG